MRHIFDINVQNNDWESRYAMRDASGSPHLHTVAASEVANVNPTRKWWDQEKIFSARLVDL